jgi:hypothetical protein
MTVAVARSAGLPSVILSRRSGCDGVSHQAKRSGAKLIRRNEVEPSKRVCHQAEHSEAELRSLRRAYAMRCA